ncbi:uncharacterized protein LOC131673494 isoform X2 [Phymastichus coffea]|uniref:uncharacterized protein LOC131673494 isoform X2 n=1 Tax=Phymastichus coffea TaxID=108790 RepID=UPI00273C9010|nr:uncharacterized protein LOC131673494 isoform X2 [Phymastichus coffea]
MWIPCLFDEREILESKEDEDESQASSLEEARELARRMHDELRRTLLFMSRLQGLPAPPGKPILIPGEEDSQPDVVGIRWERSSSNGGSAIIGYHVEHRKMGTPHWVRSAPVLCTFPELTLSGLEPGWRYQFRIRAQNALGLSEPSELSDPLTVTLQRTTSLAPRFDRDLRDCVVLEGLQAEFLVVYDGTPLPKISWFKDGFEIFSSRRTTITTDSNTSTLIIHTTSMDDEGEIKCSATNRAGHISTRAKLIIEAPPHVRLPRQYDEGLLFEQGETIRLKATNGGRPAPSITWYHNGEIIIVDSRHHFESITDNETILKITDAKRQDRGEYSIRAINKLGEDVASFLVTVTDRPAAPGKTVVMGTLGRNVTLAWQEPEDDGGCKIGTYIVEYYRLGWDVWLKAATSRQTTATLNDLIEGSEYRFRVKAENPYGLSDPSEESDIVFVPDPKRGITEPNMRAKSASQRDIPRGRSERREVSFRDASTPRTRSLTREEASNREAMAAYERTVSTQRLGTPGHLQPPVRPSRTDSRVTFALDTAGGENRRQWSKEMLPQPVEFEILDRNKTQTTVIVTPIFNDSGGETSYLESRSCSVCYSREHSPSPLELEEITERAIQERVESMNLRSQLSPPRTPRRRRSTSEVRDTHTSLCSLRRDDEENMLHGSSEFMLVLYPGAEDGKQHQATRMEKEKEVAARRDSRAKNIIADRLPVSHSTIHAPGESEDEDLVAPPPTSFSLPELFSAEHQIIEILREAVSSTELLHERAMERFYKAVEAEKSAEQIKTQFDATSAEPYPLFNPRIRPVRRRLSNSGGTAWQLRRDRRRSSEGQAKLSSSLKIPDIYEPLQNVSSDPNLPTSEEALAQKKLDAWTDNITSLRDSAERLKRWHETGIDLSQERNVSDVIGKEKAQMNKEREELLTKSELNIKTPVVGKLEEEYDEVTPDTGEILAEDSIETSGVSSEGESTDSEDLKKLKARIMAIPVVEEEDTYNPRGRMITNLDLPDIPPPVPPHRVPLTDIVTPPATPDRTNLSPTNLTPASSNSAIVPKSILKKRTDNEPIIVNQLIRPIPPEKPIKQSISSNEEYEGLSTSYKSLSNLNYINLDGATVNENYMPTPTPVPSPESLPSPELIMSPISSSPVASTLDIDREKEAVISAGEAAVTKRRQMRQGSKQLSTEEVEEEQQEERMAVVSHYTEIVKQYSSPEYRQRSLSRDREPVRRPSEPRVASPIRNQMTNQPIIQRERLPMVNQPSLQKERLPITPGKIVTPIPPIIPLIPGAKIIEPIPPVMPTTPIQKAKPIDPAEQRSRRRSRGNSIEPELRSRPRRQESTDSRPSRKSSIANSRSTTPTKLKVNSRPSSRNESPIPRSRNVSTDRSRATSVSRTNKKSKSSRPSSRSSSKDRSRAATPTEEKLERLQRALDDKRDRMRRASTNEIKLFTYIFSRKKFLLCLSLHCYCLDIFNKS